MAEPFWQRSFDTMDEAALVAFLDEGVPEGDHLEYKQPTYSQADKFEFTDEFLETIVAFANSAGGMIICGVGEDAHKRPASVEGIRLAPRAGGRSRDPVSVLQDTSASLVTPRVPLDVRSIPITNGNYAGNHLLVVRVPRGTLPPYSLRDEEIYIRNGDADRRARVREIEALFTRRAQTASEPQPPWRLMQRDVFAYDASVNLGPKHLMIGLAPLFPPATPGIEDRKVLAFRQMSQAFFGADGPYTLLPSAVAYTPVLSNGSPDVPYACGYADGTVGLRALLHLSDPEPREMSLIGVWGELQKALQFAREWPRSVCHYRGPLLARIAITGLANVAIERPEGFESPFAMPTIRNRLMTWSFETEWEGGEIRDLIQESLVSLARQLQFPMAQSLVEAVQDEAQEQR